MGKAITYAAHQWRNLETYLTGGWVEIDNNLIENSIRPTKLGAKNWLFIGAENAGEKSPIIYTVMENCRRLGIDAREYLEDVLTRLPGMTNQDDLKPLLPAGWLKEKRAKLSSQAA